jgi:protein-tyrosine-phosphatase
MRGPNGEDLPNAVLFACTQNAVRSPIAAALMRHLYGKFVYVDSVGVKKGAPDPFAAEALREIGIEPGAGRPKIFEELEDTNFDLVISLSPEAHHKAVELTRTMAVETEYWPTLDPTAVDGSREQRLDAYRQVRDGLMNRLKARFAVGPPPAP